MQRSYCGTELLIVEGIVPLETQNQDGTATMSIKDIYMLHEEFSLYDFGKFPTRLAALRKKFNAWTIKTVWSN